MRTRILGTVAATALATAALAAHTEGSEPVSIARFKHGMLGAVSITFDDGSRNQFLLAVPMLNKLGLRATFCVIVGGTQDTDPKPVPDVPGPAGGMVTWDEWRQAAGTGHEIANHSWSHVNLARAFRSLNQQATDDPSEATQLEVAREKAQLIEAQIARPGRIIKSKIARPLTYAYPYNARPEELKEVVLKDYAVERWGSIIYDESMTADAMNEAVESRVAFRPQDGASDHDRMMAGWAAPLIHGVGDESAYRPVKIDALQRHLEHLAASQDRLWIDTYAAVGRYARLRESATLTVRSQDATRVVFSLTSDLDPALFDVPLTVIVGTGTPEVTQPSATRGDAALPLIAQPGRILIDVTPSPEVVTVSWGE